MGKCPFCEPPAGSFILHNCPRCWIKKDRGKRASYTAILKAHGRKPSTQEIAHMKEMLIRQKEGWYRQGKMRFRLRGRPEQEGMVGGHYFLQMCPKEDAIGGDGSE